MKLFIDGHIHLTYVNSENLLATLGKNTNKYGAVLLLKNDKAFVGCRTETNSTFRVQIRDADTFKLYEPTTVLLSYLEVKDLFLRFLRCDPEWKSGFAWTLAANQMTPEQKRIAKQSLSTKEPGPIFSDRESQPALNEDSQTRSSTLTESSFASSASIETTTTYGGVGGSDEIQKNYDPSPWSWIVSQRGNLNSKVVCPHCTERGMVHVKKINKKAGVSGAKATGALLTGGLSLLVAGLSRSVAVTAAYCANCKSNWEF